MEAFSLARLTQPEIEPVTLDEMKKHLRAYTTITDEDDEISGLITMARAWYEQFTGRALIDQQWRQTIQNYGRPRGLLPGETQVGYTASNDEIVLRRSPVLAVLSVVAVDSAGTETEIEASAYRLTEATTKWPRIVPVSGFGGAFELRIDYRAGFADRLGSPTEGAEKVPTTAKQAIKLYAEAHYDRDPKTMQMLIDAAESVAKQESANLGLG